MLIGLEYAPNISNPFAGFYTGALGVLSHPSTPYAAIGIASIAAGVICAVDYNNNRNGWASPDEVIGSGALSAMLVACTGFLAKAAIEQFDSGLVLMSVSALTCAINPLFIYCQGQRMPNIREVIGISCMSISVMAFGCAVSDGFIDGLYV